MIQHSYMGDSPIQNVSNGVLPPIVSSNMGMEQHGQHSMSHRNMDLSMGGNNNSSNMIYNPNGFDNSNMNPNMNPNMGGGTSLSSLKASNDEEYMTGYDDNDNENDNDVAVKPKKSKSKKRVTFDDKLKKRIYKVGDKIKKGDKNENDDDDNDNDDETKSWKNRKLTKKMFRLTLDVILLCFIYLIFSLDFVRDFIGRYIKQINSNNQNHVNILGICIYGALIGVVYISLREVLFSYFF